MIALPDILPSSLCDEPIDIKVVPCKEHITVSIFAPPAVTERGYRCLWRLLRAWEERENVREQSNIFRLHDVCGIEIDFPETFSKKKIERLKRVIEELFLRRGHHEVFRAGR